MAVPQPRTSFGPPDLLSVYNEEATTLSKGMVVKRGALRDGVQLLDDTADAHLGVIREDIPTLSWGSCQIGGQAAVLAGGAIAIGDKIEGGTNGKGTAWASGAGTNTNHVGIANSVAADGELFECELSGPGAVRQG